MKLWHIGILCSNIADTIRFLGDSSGKNDWEINEMIFDEHCMVRGQGGTLRSTFGTVGGVGYELIQPMDDSSYQAQAIMNRGPGIHHVAYICGDELERIVAQLERCGGKVVWEAWLGTDHIYYVEQAEGGTVLELINNCPVPLGN